MDQDDTLLSPGGGGDRHFLRIGQQIGPYRVVRLLGSGGMGEVYEVVHSDLGSRFALKRIHPDLLSSNEGAQRFRREAQVMARLNHPNIVHVDDFQQADGEAWLRMELVEGGSLRDKMRGLRGAAFDPCKVSTWIGQILPALEYAHAQGVIHRDLKPENILLDSNGTIRVADFGLVRLADPDWLESRLRETIDTQRSLGDLKTKIDVSQTGRQGGLLGTYAYMSPEQKQGKPIGPQSDLYAVGLIAFQLLTGEDAPGFSKPSELNPRLNTAWDDWLQRAVHAKPGKRFRSARQMLDEMPGTGGAVSGKPVRRRGLRAPVFVALIAAGTAAAAGLVWFGSQLLWEGHMESSNVLPGEGYDEVLDAPAELSDTRALASLNLYLDPPVLDAQIWLGEHSALTVDQEGRVRLSELQAGSHELVVQAPGYQPVITRLEVPQSGLSYTVRLVPIRGVLKLQSQPGVSVVAVDAQSRSIDLGETDSEGVLRTDNLLRIGKYNLILSAPNRQAVEQEVLIPLGRVAEFKIELRPNPGSLRVLTTPEGAEVEVRTGDWLKTGLSPVEVDEVPAEVVLAVRSRLDGYRDIEKSIELGAGEGKSLNLGVFEPLSGGLRLRVTNPDLDREHLQLVFDSNEFEPGVSGWFEFLELHPGQYDLRIDYPDYQPIERVVELEDGGPKVLELELSPRPAELTLSVRGPAEFRSAVYYGGNRLTGSMNYFDELPAKVPLELRIEADGWQSLSKNLELAPAENRHLELELESAGWPVAGDDRVLDLPGSETIRLKWLPAGRFFMGSPETELGRYDWEGPLTRVEFEAGFWMAETPVTVGQFRAFVDHSGYRSDAERETDRGVRVREDGQWVQMPDRSWQDVFADDPNRPVVGVSWRDAQAFVLWLNEIETAAGRLPDGFRYGLPSEAEWEYAARAGNRSRWYFGDSRQLLDAHAWYMGNSGGSPQPVANKPPNPWGLYDMHGNVWEWTRSVWTDRLPGGYWPASAVDDRAGHRVYRGGSWANEANQTRSAHRLRSAEDFRSSSVGFRIGLFKYR